MDPLPAKAHCVDSAWSLTLLVKHELEMLEKECSSGFWDKCEDTAVWIVGGKCDLVVNLSEDGDGQEVVAQQIPYFS